MKQFPSDSHPLNPIVASDAHVKKNSNLRMQIDQPLIFLRHGETDWNVAGRYQGHQDTYLSDTGRQQAGRCADDIARLTARCGFTQSNISMTSSPLARAMDTAAIIAKKLEFNTAHITTAQQLKELSMGRWEGLNSQQVKDQFYTERQSRKARRWEFKPRGGQSLCDREPEIASWLTNVPAHTIVVTHSGILKIIHRILAGSDDDQSSVIKVGHAEIWVWVCDKLHTSMNEIARS